MGCCAALEKEKTSVHHWSVQDTYILVEKILLYSEGTEGVLYGSVLGGVNIQLCTGRSACTTVEGGGASTGLEKEGTRVKL